MTTSIKKQEQSDLAFGGKCTPLPNGLIIEKDTTFDEWAKIGNTLRRIEGAVAWWLGDWWLHGERAYGEMASQEAKDELCEQTGYDYNSIRKYAYVSDRIEFETRVSNLSHRHHMEVAGIEDKQKRIEWLKTAEAEGLSARELKASIVAGHVVRVADLMAQAEGKVTLNLIQGVVGHARMWLNNVAPKVKWTPELAQQLEKEVINPLEQMCNEMRTKIRGTSTHIDL